MVSMFKHSIWNKVPNDLINPSLAVSMNTFKHSLCYFHSSLLYQFSFKKNFGGRFMTTYIYTSEKEPERHFGLHQLHNTIKKSRHALFSISISKS